MPIAIDFETYLISNEQPNPKPVCLSSYKLGLEPKLYVGLNEIEEALKDALKEDVIIAHNAIFELLVIFTWFPKLKEEVWKSLEEGRWFCTKLYQQLIDNVSKKQIMNHTLSNLVQVYFDEDISATKTDPEAWRLRYSELEGVPKSEWPKAAIDYSLEDSIWAYKLYLRQIAEYELSYTDQIYDGFCLNVMSSKGILIDLERVEQLEKECWEKIIPSYLLLNEHGFIKLRCKHKKDGTLYASPVDLYKRTENNLPEIIEKQKVILQDWLNQKDLYVVGKFLTEIHKYIEKTFKNVIRTEKKVVSTTSEAIACYISEQPDNKVITSLDTIGDYEKALTAFVARLKTANPVIRSTYNPIVSSGRTSARTTDAYPSVNIQQMPRGIEGVTWDIRNCFVPRDGFIFSSIDYSGLELASTAHQLYVSNAGSDMRDTINGGNTPTDMHSKLAARFKSLKEKKVCTYDEFVQNKKKPGYKEYRTLAKPINLGFPGGIGYDTMRELLTKEGLILKYKVISKSKWEEDIDEQVKQYRREGYPVRKKQLGRFEFALVYDELVELKQELFALYPDLHRFLTHKHEEFMTGETRAKRNEFGMWESDDMYAFNVNGVRRDWCTYTALCNGYLMQTPAAIGAKLAVRNCVRKYIDNPLVNMLSFIHDEINFEISLQDNIEKRVLEQCEIMIDSMQTVLNTVRIAVEAQTMTYWAKNGNMDTWTAWKNPGESKLYWRKDT